MGVDEEMREEKKMVGVVRPHFVLFGSSIVQLCFRDGGWGSILTDLYARKADIILRGYAGWNSRRALEVLDQLFPKEASVQPSLVIVYFGGNDSMHPHPSGLGPHVPVQEYIQNMKKIATHLKSLSEKIRIIFLTNPPINEEQLCAVLRKFGHTGDIGRSNELCRIYSEACLEACKEENVKAIDLWSALQKTDDWKDVCFADGVHLSTEGNKRVAKEIVKCLKEAEWEPSLFWKSMPNEFSQDSPYYPLGSDGKTINVSDWTWSESKEWD